MGIDRRADHLNAGTIGTMVDSKKQSGGPAATIDAIKLTVASFAVAMAFRSFVVEPFVIPSPSMAPTLLGEHVRWKSDVTGYEYPIDAKILSEAIKAFVVPPKVCDPMLGSKVAPWSIPPNEFLQQARWGDRIVVLKWLYNWTWLGDMFAPKRWDVVVFKYPVDPFSIKQNFVKRMVGLPDESLLMTDGDVFTSNVPNAGLADLRVQRKPDHVQRTVWQPVYDSDYVPIDMDRIRSIDRRGDLAQPWSGEGWATQSENGQWLREYRCNETRPCSLRWNTEARPIDDWNVQNVMVEDTVIRPRRYPVSDVRVAATVAATDPAALTTKLRIGARSHWFDFELGNRHASLRLIRAEDGLEEDQVSVAFEAPDKPFEVDFWHVDQRMAIYVNGELVTELTYDWSAADRLKYAMVGRQPQELTINNAKAPPTTLEWTFDGSPVTLRRVRVDRDLYYQPAEYHREGLPEGFKPTSRGMGFGTDPLNPAVLGPDEFMMCGDNSPISDDARTWRAPHALVRMTIDPSPFVVNRKMLLGKAWGVLLPSPVPFSRGGRNIIPDFGRWRFIR